MQWIWLIGLTLALSGAAPAQEQAQPQPEQRLLQLKQTSEAEAKRIGLKARGVTVRVVPPQQPLVAHVMADGVIEIRHADVLLKKDHPQ